jgi:hypothetical protein
MRKTHQDDVRAKIQASNLITRLQSHISGEIALENSQIKAIEVLLDRSLPKLSSIEMSGPEGGPMRHAVEVTIIDPKH